jgi:hypothetical protein
VILSASVNLFDGEELLVPMLRALRPQVDHVSVVFQTISNWHQPTPVDLIGLIAELTRAGLIDDSVHYDPCHPDVVARSPAAHESAKRTIGLELARSWGASHMLSLDVDEFFDAAQFTAARAAIDAAGWDATACRIQEYHARPIYQRTTLADYDRIDLYVPFIYAIAPGAAFDPTIDFFCTVDPTRKLAHRAPHAFAPAALLMHHMLSVRRSWDSLLRKFTNSTSRSPLEPLELLADLVATFDPATHVAPSVRVVPDRFGIEAFWGSA